MDCHQFLILCLAFAIGLLYAAHSLRDSFAAPTVESFCSPPSHLLDQWTMKQWKIFGIPRVAASESFDLVDPMKHNMRDYKYHECRSFAYQVSEDGGNFTYTIDENSTTPCTSGYSFEDPGARLSYSAEVRMFVLSSG